MPKRIDATPFLVHGQSGACVQLESVPVTQQMIDEKWLQNLVEKHPEIVPAGEIDPVFAPLVSIGREVPTQAGFIDHLFISPSGYLTIVETKLWRNPQARREVVGQIIDYAKEVSRWSFSDLDGLVRSYIRRVKGTEQGVIDCIRELEPLDEQDEALLADTISRNMHQGKFLLLVAGDGIRESVEEMAAFMQQHTHMHFTLVLVEMKIYKMPHDEKAWIVLPQVVTRTREIVRAIVKVQQPESAAVPMIKVDVHEDIERGEKSSHRNGAGSAKRFTITREDFMAALRSHHGDEGVAFAERIIAEAEERGCIIEWKKGSFVVKLPDPEESGYRVTLFVITTEGIFYLGWLPDQLENLGLSREIAARYVRDLAKIFNCSVSKKGDGLSRNIPLPELIKRYDAVMDRVDELIREIRKQSGSVY